MNKITLGVLFGGVSSEHDISTVSAKGILSAIDKEKYNLVLLGITKEGRGSCLMMILTCCRRPVAHFPQLGACLDQPGSKRARCGDR